MASYTPRYRDRNNAFTLVELLVVIGIIAILVAIILPSLMKARIQALQTMCGSNQHQIYLATVLYATDNHGYLPGTFSQYADEGAIYFQSSQYGGYPWEYKNDPNDASNTSNETNFGSPNNEPTDVAAAARVEWFGVGCLVGGHYLPPTKIVECPDFFTPSNVNFSYRGNFTLTNLYYSTSPPGDVRFMWTTSANTGSYVLNTIPYYSTDPSNLARGRFGPGRQGGHEPDVSDDQRVPHITALIMCMSSENPSQQFSNGMSYAHRGLGVNCTFIDGHTSWLPLGAGDWRYLNQKAQNPASSTDTDLDGNETTFWVWATRKNGM